MKKTINSLLLALAVCGGSAYGDSYNDDKKAINYFDHMSREMEDPDKVLQEGKDRLEKWVALQQIGTMLQAIKIDVSEKKPDEIKKLAQDQIKLLEQKIKNASQTA